MSGTESEGVRMPTGNNPVFTPTVNLHINTPADQ